MMKNDWTVTMERSWVMLS